MAKGPAAFVIGSRGVLRLFWLILITLFLVILRFFWIFYEKIRSQDFSIFDKYGRGLENTVVQGYKYGRCG